MEDLTTALQNFLGSEEGMKQLEDLSKMFGMDSKPNDENTKPKNEATISPDDILKIQNLISDFNKENPNTTLLKSLKPLLKEERRHKVDEAVRIMKLISLLPTLRESGILNNLLE